MLAGWKAGRAGSAGVNAGATNEIDFGFTGPVENDDEGFGFETFCCGEGPTGPTDGPTRAIGIIGLFNDGSSSFFSLSDFGVM